MKPTHQIHITLTIPDKKYLVLILSVTIFIIGSTLAYSTSLKKQGDIQYKNGGYKKALETYRQAQKWWLPETLNFKLRDRNLYSKIEKAKIMIHSSESYDLGKKAFEKKQYVRAKEYLINLAENDPKNKEAKRMLVIIDKYLFATPTPIRTPPIQSEPLTFVTTPTLTLTSIPENKPSYVYDSYYPIILSLSDNKGGQIKYSESNQHSYSSTSTGITLKKGDTIRWTAEASDPKERQILYQFHSNSQRQIDAFGRGQYKTENWFEYTLNEEDLKDAGDTLRIVLYIKSEKDNYRRGGNGPDDSTFLDYKLQPN